jgi:hypothetical protein
MVFPTKNNSRAPMVHEISMNDLPLIINSISEPTLFADSTRVIISSRHFTDFCPESNFILSYTIKWFCC